MSFLVVCKLTMFGLKVMSQKWWYIFIFHYEKGVVGLRAVGIVQLFNIHYEKVFNGIIII